MSRRLRRSEGRVLVLFSSRGGWKASYGTTPTSSSVAGSGVGVAPPLFRNRRAELRVDRGFETEDHVDHLGVEDASSCVAITAPIPALRSI